MDDGLETGICEHCGEREGYLQIDPYDLEVEGEENERILCDECAKALYMQT